MEAVAHEELGGRYRDDDDRLDQLNHRAGDLIEDLEALPRDEKHPDERRDEDREERIVTGEKADEDAGESVADEEGLGHPAFDAGAEDEAANSRYRAGEKRRRQCHRADLYPDSPRHARIG